MVKTWENAILNPLWRKTVFKKDLYSIGRFDAKRIFQREMVTISENGVGNPKCNKTHFSRKSFIS